MSQVRHIDPSPPLPSTHQPHQGNTTEITYPDFQPSHCFTLSQTWCALHFNPRKSHTKSFSTLEIASKLSIMLSAISERLIKTFTCSCRNSLVRLCVKQRGVKLYKCWTILNYIGFYHREVMIKALNIVNQWAKCFKVIKPNVIL